MLSADDAYQIVAAGVVVLVGLCLTIAWAPARGHYPGGLPSRAFVTVGLMTVFWDPGGLGIVGAVLTAMGVAIWWCGRPEPELPRPRRAGLVVAAVASGIIVLATDLGWGALGRIPDDARALATVVVIGVVLLGTLAIADRARVTYRDALRRRFRPVPGPPPPPPPL
ncbi:hypothetical protein [Phytoactinopolyspora limicola]|uniref:hypothetical protein n=1 Tax=Phytoactinopolyspora limicola TaxID=2715536 RepID=UPI00140B2026|nr:hypothetical protein [Phytoactinopolyspora limicola]